MATNFLVNSFKNEWNVIAMIYKYKFQVFSFTHAHNKQKVKWHGDVDGLDNRKTGEAIDAFVAPPFVGGWAGVTTFIGEVTV